MPSYLSLELKSAEHFSEQDLVFAKAKPASIYNPNSPFRITLAVLTAASTSVSYFESGRHFGGDNQVLGYFYGVGGVASVILLNSWLFDTLFQLGFDGFVIHRNRKTCLKLVVIFLLALLSAIPDTCIAYAYNTHARYLAIFAFLGDFISGNFSYSKLWSSIRRGLPLCSRVEQFRMALIGHIYSGATTVVNLPKSELAILYQKYFPENPTIEQHIQLMKGLLFFLMQRGGGCNLVVAQKAFDRYHRLPYLITLLIAIIWPIFRAILYERAVEKSLEIEFHFPIEGARTIGILSVIPSFLLMFFLLHEIMNVLIQLTAEILARQFQPNYAWRFNTIIYSNLIFLSFLCVAFSFGTAGSVAKEHSPYNLVALFLPMLASLVLSAKGFAAFSFVTKISSFFVREKSAQQACAFVNVAGYFVEQINMMERDALGNFVALMDLEKEGSNEEELRNLSLLHKYSPPFLTSSAHLADHQHLLVKL
jgi:hypothetical protein